MNDSTSIFRIRKRTCPFVQIDKTVFEDTRLSWKAKGLLGYLLSRPDDWTINLGDLVKRSKDGRMAVQSAMKELSETGYARRKKVRGERGRLAGEKWFIFEEPIPAGVGMDDDGNLQLALTGEQVSRPPVPTGDGVSRTPENPDAGKTATTNKDITNKEKGVSGPKFDKAWGLCPHTVSDVFVAKWAEWEEYRRAKRKPISELAAVKQLSELGGVALADAIAAIYNSIRNDWTGLFPAASSGGSNKKAAFA